MMIKQSDLKFTPGPWVKVKPIDYAERLFNIKQLEYRISYLDERLERRAAAEKLNRIEEPEFREESRRISVEFEELNTQLSKLLED